MVNIKLSKEEARILNDFEEGKLKRLKGAKTEKGKYQQYAKYTLGKSRTINIRLSARDIQKIKALAAEKGLPYQTFISSLLHQHSSRKIKEPSL